jgi:hypothetical protein
MDKLWHDIFKNKSNKNYSSLGKDRKKQFIRQLTTSLGSLQRRLAEARNMQIKKLILVDADKDYIKNFKIAFSQCPMDNTEEYFLYKKDINRISDRMFRSFKIDFKFDIVSLDAIRKLRKKFNNQVIFTEIVEKDVSGLYLDPKVAIEKKIRYLIKKEIKILNNIIKIKLSADGMNVYQVNH